MENAVLKVLEERRSVRSYQNKQVEKDALDAILRAGTYAATGMNRQSPIIVAVQNPETIKMLSAMNAAVMGREGSDPFYGAPTVVIVLADPNVRTYVEDGSLVIGNMMNAAFALGVDSCWIHRAKEVFATEEGRTLLKEWGISGEYVGIGNLILGYREGDLPAVRPRKDNYIYYV